MKYAVIDTENNGLFRFKEADGTPVPADAPGQPRLAQLGMIMLDENLQEVDAITLYVKPDGWTMPQGPGTAGEVNGLTDEFLMAHGTPIGIVLEQYVRIIDAGYKLAAYNAQHDLKQMRAELRRAGLDDRFDRTPNICLMRASMSLKVKKAKGGGGWPSLADCCAHFGIARHGEHTADGDARDALEVFRHLHRLDALPEARVHASKVPPLHAKEPQAGLSGTRATTVILDGLPERF